MQAPGYMGGAPAYPPHAQASLGAYGAFLNMCNPYAHVASDPMAAWYVLT